MSITKKTIATVEDGLAILEKQIHIKRDKMAYDVLFVDGDIITHADYSTQPCYGELRPYGKTHPDMMPEHQRGVSKPGDLHSPFPDGTPIAVGMPFFSPPRVSDEEYNRIMNLILDPGLSPWKAALKDFDVIKNANNRIIGVIIKNTEVDSTVMVNMFMCLRGGCHSGFYENLTQLLAKFPDEDPYVLLAVATQLSKSWDSQGSLVIGPNFAYYLSAALNVKKFLVGEFDEKITGGTFRNRYAYNRPDLHNVFGANPQTWTKVVHEKLGKTSFAVDQLQPVIDLFKAA